MTPPAKRLVTVVPETLPDSNCVYPQDELVLSSTQSTPDEPATPAGITTRPVDWLMPAWLFTGNETSEGPLPKFSPAVELA